MTYAKIAITLPEDQLARIKRAVKQGHATSVSAYIARTLAEKESEESLSSLVRDLAARHGEPSRQEKTWARKALRRQAGE